MDKDFCSYHYRSPATFRCDACFKHFGDCCICRDLPERVCPLCGQELVSLGAANTAPPFWEQMHEFFRYPFQPAPLAMIGATAIGMTLTSLPGVLKLVAVVSLLCAFTKYAYSVIQASKEGQDEPPSFASAFSSDNLDLFFKQIGVFLVAGVAIFAAGAIGGGGLAVIVSLAINLLIPASVIVLAIGNQVGPAVNPIVLFSVVKGIGARYLLLFLFVQLLSQGPAIAIEIIGDSLSPGLFAPVLMALFGYFGLVTARLLGYSVFQNQAGLGFVAEHGGADQGADLTEDEINLLEVEQARKRVEVLVKEGRYKEARAALADKLNQRDTDLTRPEDDGHGQ